MSVLWLWGILLTAQGNVSARSLLAAQSPSQRVSTVPAIAPGPPPLLSFRYYEGRLHHRFGSVDLVLDDAGH